MCIILRITLRDSRGSNRKIESVASFGEASLVTRRGGAASLTGAGSNDDSNKGEVFARMRVWMVAAVVAAVAAAWRGVVGVSSDSRLGTAMGIDTGEVTEATDGGAAATTTVGIGVS